MDTAPPPLEPAHCSRAGGLPVAPLVHWLRVADRVEALDGAKEYKTAGTTAMPTAATTSSGRARARRRERRESFIVPSPGVLSHAPPRSAAARPRPSACNPSPCLLPW